MATISGRLTDLGGVSRNSSLVPSAWISGGRHPLSLKCEIVMIPCGRAGFCACAAILTIALGITLRRYGYDLSLPFLIVKYGGSLLWGSMVYFIVAALSFRLSSRISTAMAFAIAVLVELFRLYHNVWLDEFRLTTAGALLIGRVFSVWNIIAYGCGIVLAYAVTRKAGFHSHS